MLSKVLSSSIFKVFGMTRPGIEPRSPGPLANTLTAGPMSRLSIFLTLFTPIEIPQRPNTKRSQQFFYCRILSWSFSKKYLEHSKVVFDPCDHRFAGDDRKRRLNLYRGVRPPPQKKIRVSWLMTLNNLILKLQ